MDVMRLEFTTLTNYHFAKDKFGGSCHMVTRSIEIPAEFIFGYATMDENDWNFEHFRARDVFSVNTSEGLQVFTVAA